VVTILRELGVDDRPRLHVLNKTDALSAEDLRALKQSNGRNRNNVLTSAMTGEGVSDLLARIDAALPVDRLVRLRLRLPLSAGRDLALVQSTGRVLHLDVHDGSYLVRAVVPQSTARQLKEFVLE
jgi:GTP-binding protein HflX